MRDLASIRKEIESVRATMSSADATLIDLLLGRLNAWHDDDSSARELVDDLDRILGSIWFSTEENHAATSLVLARLRKMVAAIDGMTMNERLFAFDLLQRWDQSTTEAQGILYTKLHATR